MLKYKDRKKTIHKFMSNLENFRFDFTRILCYQLSCFYIYLFQNSIYYLAKRVFSTMIRYFNILRYIQYWNHRMIFYSIHNWIQRNRLINDIKRISIIRNTCTIPSNCTLWNCMTFPLIPYLNALGILTYVDGSMPRICS